MRFKLFIVMIALAVLPVQACIFRKKVEIINQPQKILNVKCGADVVIKLDANPTTGYDWKLRILPENTDILKFKEDKYIAPKSQLAGAGGVYKFVVKANKKGTASIQGEYSRPWEKNNAASTVNYDIIVE